MRPQSGAPQHRSPDEKPRYMLAVIFAIVAVLALGGSAVLAINLLHQSATIKGTSPQPTTVAIVPTATPSPGVVNTQPTGPISPLIFGVNLGLFNDNDQVVQSEQTRTLMQQLHIKIVRLPVRKNISPDVFTKALQDIKDIGAVPLVALIGLQSPDVMLSNDISAVKSVNAVFGNTRVYYEFGNEDDYHGIEANSYTDAWNTVIPQLKAIAPQAHFVGPVSWQYDEPFLISFLQNAKVQPDEISWHEYTCDIKWATDLCLSNLDKWTTHISAARQAMANTIGKVLPIMITEWNYTASQSNQSNGLPIDDGKYNNTQFMTDWTTKALKVLADNRVFASMQYTVTDTALPMITYKQTVTIQGTTFQAVYQQMFPGAS